MPIAPAREKIKPLRPSQKVQPARQILARKPRYPTGKTQAAGRPRIGRLPDPGILPWANNQPEIARRNGALVVGYLGFRAKIFLNRCTNCSRKTSPILLLPLPPIGESRRRAPSPPPAATQLTKPMARRARRHETDLQLQSISGEGGRTIAFWPTKGHLPTATFSAKV